MMTTHVSIHLQEDMKMEVAVRPDYSVIKLGPYDENGLYFRSEEHLRTFAESILQQLEKKELNEYENNAV